VLLDVKFVSEFNVKEHKGYFAVNHRLYLDIMKLSKGAAVFNLSSSSLPRHCEKHSAVYFLTLLMPNPRNRMCYAIFLLKLQTFGGYSCLPQI
jgi:hypothetical protein